MTTRWRTEWAHEGDFRYVRGVLLNGFTTVADEIGSSNTKLSNAWFGPHTCNTDGVDAQNCEQKDLAIGHSHLGAFRRSY